jgi:hypothetical protein
MTTTRLWAAVMYVAVVATPVRAQDPPHNEAVRVEHLWSIFNDLYGPSGLVVDSSASLAGGQSHSGHFTGGFESEFSQFGVALTSQLVSLPQPTPAAGFTYEFDPALGIFNRTTNNFGPIMSERAETIGARRLSAGFATQRLEFDLIEGLNLNQIPAVFSHDNAELLGGREDVVTTVNSVDASFTRSTLFLTYGVTNRFDVSVAIPWVTADMTVTSDATIRRIGTRIPEIHFFRTLEDNIGDRRIFTAFGNASGLGDVNLRAKVTLSRTARQGFALGVDLRLPSGEELDLLGTGAPGVQPYAVWSASFGPFSPHVNAGYQWNGSSVLGGGPGAGESRDLPDVVRYSAGAAIELHPRVTLAGDVLGRWIIDSPRLSSQTFHALDGVTTFPDIAFRKDSLNELSAATGLKINILNRLLVNANLLFRLNSVGLVDKVSPLLGLEYAF